MEQDEIYIADLWRVFAREWRWFAIVLVVVLACTFAFIHATKRQWEATAWFQIAQVGQVPSGQDPHAESLQRVLERLQTADFQNQVLKNQGFALDSPEARLYRKSVKLDPSPYGQMIKLNVRGASADLAGRLATATVNELHALHQQIESAPLHMARATLVELQEQLDVATADRDRLLQIVNGKPGQEASLAAVLLASKTQEVRSLRQSTSDLTARLSPTYTFDTSLVFPVYVPEGPSFPNVTLGWGIGIVFGLFLGALAAMARNAFRRASTR
ncbi:Wzz/FepE/Etk N-terminal domain-containing protein [Pinirhizobacter sp.]|jgi:hypothetical protein|uniref:Wzz/FepE/Etk N-terminal domain-containing protein n=1 Tax=Pinirhizobacter sp. TaxID=2950432 RepID=UPI002F41418F